MTSATWVIKEHRIVTQAIDATDTTQNHAMGALVRAGNSTYGDGMFIYLTGVASTVVGSLVTYDQYLGTTTLAPSTANLEKPLAVAMSINNSTTNYGWYQVIGAAVIATNGTLASVAAPVYLAGSGQITGTQANGKQVINATSSTATGTPASGFAVVQINMPVAQGQVV